MIGRKDYSKISNNIQLYLIIYFEIGNIIDFIKVKIFCKLRLLKYIVNPGEIKITANKVEAKLLQVFANALNQKYFFL